MTIRPTTIADVPTIYSMLRASAAEQGGLDKLCVGEASLREDGFGAAPRFQVVLAEVNGKAVGLALYFFIYSTWISSNGLYLEDLYVAPEFRRAGVARALMQHLARAAEENGCGRMIWLVLRNNPAVKFYERIGAEAGADWMPMHITGPALKELAS